METDKILNLISLCWMLNTGKKFNAFIYICRTLNAIIHVPRGLRGSRKLCVLSNKISSYKSVPEEKMLSPFVCNLG